MILTYTSNLLEKISGTQAVWGMPSVKKMILSYHKTEWGVRHRLSRTDTGVLGQQNKIMKVETK